MNHSYEELKKLLSTYMEEDYIEYVDKYYNELINIFEDEKNISHPLNVAYTLADLKMDPITIGCALIHEVISLDKLTYEEIEEKFGIESANIIQSVTKISNLKQTFKVNDPEKYRRILVGLAENASALFIKLADRLINLKSLGEMNEKNKKYIIEETQTVYIPIAHRLGLKQIKSEMEDLCLRYGDPKEYNKILNKMNASYEELNSDLNEMKESICDMLDELNIKYTITSRVKSVRGIYNKLQDGKNWENIYDLLGVRVLVGNIEDCYRVIGLIQSKFNPLPNRFKDFIANPKANGYQSLHTTVFGVNNRMYEVQVRTYEMDEVAEKGVASHWSYKEKTNGAIKNVLDNTLEYLRTLIELNDIESNMEFFSNIKEELKREEIYCITPKGDVIELPFGSTPIDFAYKIHSEVGHQTTAALVNSKMVKLDYKLQDGDMVELITQKGRKPSKNWLKIVKTEGAKSRIKSYFYKAEREKYISSGKEILLNECKKKNLDFNAIFNEENVKKLLESLKLDTIEDLYFSVSTLRYLPSTIFNKLDVKAHQTKVKKTFEKKTNKHGILIAGQDDILCSLAECCKPVHGEDIVGFITRGYGVKIHSKNCSNIDLNSDRIIEASWEEDLTQKYKTRIHVYISVIGDVLEQMASVCSKHDIIIDSFNLINRNNNLFYDMTLKVNNIERLNNFIDEIKLFKDVIKVERVFI